MMTENGKLEFILSSEKDITDLNVRGELEACLALRRAKT